MQQPPVWYLSDLDGTLLNDKAEIPGWSRATLVRLLNQGVPFSVATARGIQGMQLMLGELPFFLPVIGGNGAFISDYQTGQHLKLCTMPWELCEELLEVFRYHNLQPVVSLLENGEDRLLYPDRQNEVLARLVHEKLIQKDRRLRPMGEWKSWKSCPITSFSLIEKEAVVLDLKVELEEKFGEYLQIHLYEDTYYPGWFMFSAIDRAATKGNAARWLAEYLGWESSELIVFGDNLNDISLFEAASESVAVANAKEPLKAIANHIIGTNESEAVISFVEDHVKSRYGI
ncbi:MAG: HAD family hydrolase [Bacteroidota bacterium]